MQRDFMRLRVLLSGEQGDTALQTGLRFERVRAGMRRARLEGRHIGRRPLDIDHDAVLRQRIHGQSISQLAKTFSIPRATVSRILKQSQQACQKGLLQTTRKYKKTGSRFR